MLFYSEGRNTADEKSILLLLFLLLGISLVACGEQDLQHDEIFAKELLIFAEGDQQDSITKDFELITKTAVANATLTWLSTNENVVRIEGKTAKVTRSESDQKVTIILKLNIEGVTKEKHYELTVKKLETTVDRHDQVFSENLLILASGDQLNHITQDLNLMTLSQLVPDATLTWESSDQQIITLEGKVIRGAMDQTVTLTLKVTIAGVEKTKTYTLTVKGEPILDSIPPMITGVHNYRLTVGDPAPDWLKGVSAHDEVDGEVAVIIDENNVDLSKPGVYTITYAAMDAANNKATATAHVVVDPKTSGGNSEVIEEDFENFKGNGTSYVNQTFKGANDIELHVSGGRKDLSGYDIGGGGIILGKDVATLKATITGGIKKLSFAVRQAFSGSPSVEVYINQQKVGTKSLSSGLVETVEIDRLNIEGTFTLEIKAYQRLTINHLKIYQSVASPEEQNLNKDLEALELITTYYQAGPLALIDTGTYGSQITWSYADPTNVNNALVDLVENYVSMPLGDNVQVTLLATLKNGVYETHKLFILTLGKLKTQTIAAVAQMANGSIVATTGIVAAKYETSQNLIFYLQDGTGGIEIVAPLTYSEVQVGSEVYVVGTKSSFSSMPQIKEISELSVLGTKTVNGTTITDPIDLDEYIGELVMITGLLKQSYSDQAVRYTLLTENGAFEVMIPTNMVNKQLLQQFLQNQPVGLEVTVIGPVVRSNQEYQVYLTSLDNVLLADEVDVEQVKALIFKHLHIPTFNDPVTNNLDLNEYLSESFAGVKITWSSSDPEVISVSGIVTPQTEATTVVLTYKLEWNEVLLGQGQVVVIVGARSSYNPYYATAYGKTGDALKQALHEIISGHRQLSYEEVWDAIMDTDEDPNNKNNVILLYSGESRAKSKKGGNAGDWNREHVWAKSHGDFGTDKGPGTDIHHLRATDVTINSKRGYGF